MENWCCAVSDGGQAEISFFDATDAEDAMEEAEKVIDEAMKKLDIAHIKAVLYREFKKW